MRLSENIIKKQANKYKHFLEKAVLFYPYKKNTDMYIMVRYNRFGKVTGDLILTANGEVVSHEQATPIFQDYTKYDSCMKDCVTLVARSKELLVRSPKKIRQLLTENVIPAVHKLKDSSILEDVENVLTAMEAYIHTKHRFQDIYDEYVSIDIPVQGKDQRGYLTEVDVERVMKLNKESDLLNFDMLRKDREALDSYFRLESLCKERPDMFNHMRDNTAHDLLQLLSGFTNQSNIAVLKKSLQRFEVDETQKNPKTFSKGEKGRQEFAETFDKSSDYLFKTNVLPLLRNP